MKREHTNIVRFIIEDCLPPIIRDLPLFNTILSKASGMDLKKCRQLRKNIPFLSSEELSAFYKDYPRIQDETDNSSRCIQGIIDNVAGNSLCDVGCGTGHLIERIRQRSNLDTLAGVDFSEYDEWAALSHIRFYQHDIMDLPFSDGQWS
ncbi:MAG: class I SAM-dependent methyltransferase [Planctomycetota bacterium]|jgi:SAM-dependent methyltransferase